MIIMQILSIYVYSKNYFNVNDICKWTRIYRGSVNRDVLILAFLIKLLI